MKRVKDKLVELSEDEELIGVYDKEIVDRKVRNSMIKSALIDGEKKGLEKGKIAGINEEKLNIAKNLLEMNMDIKDISKATGLTIEQIKNI